MPDETLRIVDANLNRAGEGLRLLEEIARLLLNDAALTQQLKTMRHELLREDIAFHTRLLQARDASGDVGATLEVPDQDKRQELPLIVAANAKRVQQSLRVLEEIAKTPGAPPQLEAGRFQRARFALYTIERELISRLLRKDKSSRLGGLYVIIDTELLKGRSHVEVARQTIRGGAGVLQLRDKTTAKRDLLDVARHLKALCAEHGVLFIVNDHLDIALEAGADGLHVGQEDLPAGAARNLLPLDMLLGISARTVELAQKAEADGADYLGVGAMYPTPSKVRTVVVGLERLRQIRQAVALPLVAIGGITPENAGDVIAAGASSVAVMGYILNAPSPEEAARQVVARLETKG